MRTMESIALCLALASGACAQRASEAMTRDPAEEPGLGETQAQGSIYALAAQLEGDRGESIGLDVDRGHPTIVAMFYATCPAACPTLVSDIKAIERRLSPSERADVRVLLVSFDAERDTPPVLDALATKHGVDRARWRFASARERDARAIAALLGVQYHKAGDGQFSHSAEITLLDRDGAIAAQLEGLGAPSDAIVSRIRALTAVSPRHR